jgi:hypothetical protein
MAKWYILWILWPFGTFCGHLVHFPRFGILYREKSGNPGVEGVLFDFSGLLIACADCSNRSEFRFGISTFKQPLQSSEPGSQGNGNSLFFYKKLPPFTRAGIDLTTHSSSLLGGRRRRYH